MLGSLLAGVPRSITARREPLSAGVPQRYPYVLGPTATWVIGLGFEILVLVHREPASGESL